MTDRSLQMLAKALEMEQKGYSFYEKAIGQCTNDVGRDVFTKLRDDELIHIDRIKKIYAALEGGGQWEELPVMDPAMLQMFDAFSMVYWWDMLFTGDPGDAQYLGQEVVNGVQSHHYRTAETDTWGFTQGCTFASAQDDLWVAVDGSFPVKRQFDAAGECQGESGEVHFLMELSNVNQPVNITPPI